MKLESHIVAGLVGTAILYPILGPAQSMLFFTSSVLIDSDHYLEYLRVTRGKDWSPARMFRFYSCFTEHNSEKEVLGFSLFHTIEIFIVVYLLAKYLSSFIFIPILLGMTYHMIFDIACLTYHGVPTVRAFSIVEYFIRKKLLLKKGINPEDFYKKMFELSEKK
ncbi:MAG: hypothetical protein WCO12_03505 [bacterium]